MYKINVISYPFLLLLITVYSSIHEVDLIAQLGELQNEDNVSCNMKAPCPIYGQSTI